MEIEGDKVLLNGHVVSVRRAHSIITVQCAILRKKYEMDANKSPVEIIIHGYEPDENDLKPDAEDGIGETTLPVQHKVEARKCGNCGGTDK